jgi:hypothetical protein
MPGRNPGHLFAAQIISNGILIHENSELFFLGIAPGSHSEPPILFLIFPVMFQAGALFALVRHFFGRVRPSV